MKKIFTILLGFAFVLTQAQVDDRTVTDCDNNSRSIYSSLTSGKVLLVASEGFDCSICRGKASDFQNWAAQNSGVEVWAAMTFTYSGDVPACSDVSQWINDYNWTDIYTFIDESEYWFSTGTPQYYVYDPRDSSLAYRGFSESEAQNTASSLASSLSIPGKIELEDFFIGQGEGFVSLNKLNRKIVDYTLYNLTGKLIFSGRLDLDLDNKINTNDLQSGTYLLKISAPGGFDHMSKIFLK